MSMAKRFALAAPLALLASAAVAADTPGLGKPASEADLALWDMSIAPDGKGLPPGSGTSAQGAVIYALTAALNGEITVKDGAAEQENFDTYEMLRIADAPPVETVIVPSGGFWGGVGEPPVPPLAPALCNAIFAATGQRIRSLPVKNHDLRSI